VRQEQVVGRIGRAVGLAYFAILGAVWVCEVLKPRFYAHDRGIGLIAALLGLLFIGLSLVGTEVRPALSFGHGPSRPPTVGDRVTFFVAGVGSLGFGVWSLVK
jgi:hypothetical protein